MPCKLKPLPAGALKSLDKAALFSRRTDIEVEIARIGGLKRISGPTRRDIAALRQELIGIEAILTGAAHSDGQNATLSDSVGSGGTQATPATQTQANGLANGESKPRVAKIYAVPRNRYLRLIEFQDGTRGVMNGFRPTPRLRAGWNVKVEPG